MTLPNIPVTPPLQAQPYDNILKLLIEDQEEAVLPEIWPQVEYIETKNVEIVRSPLRVDRVYEVRYRKQEHILHVEFETSSDKKLDYRLLDYHAYFLKKYELPVLTIVVYPFRTTVVESPLLERSGDETILTFHYRTLCLWKLDAEDFLQEQKVFLYALLPAMRGATEPVLRAAVEALEQAYKHDTKRLSKEITSFGIIMRRVREIPAEVKRNIEERIKMWDNLIAEDPKFQQWFSEYEKKGEEKGVAAMQRVVIRALDRLSVSLAEELKAKVESIRSLEALEQLDAELSITKDEMAARRIVEAYIRE